MLGQKIAVARFTSLEILKATQGECLFFAIALHRLMLPVLPSLRLGVLCIYEPKNWLHIVVENNGILYDIRGSRPLLDYHSEYLTERLILISTEKELAAKILLYTNICEYKVEYWYKRLDSFWPDYGKIIGKDGGENE